MSRTLTRRHIAAQLAAAGLAIPAIRTISAQEIATQVDPEATPVTAGNPIPHRGINYDTGTNYDEEPGYISRPDAHRAFFSAEIAAIRDQLHCTTICLYGSEPDRLIEAATIAIDAGLNVRIQPRIVGGLVDQLPAIVQEIARSAAAIEITGDTEIVFDLGCELTIFASGIIPGTLLDERLVYLLEHLDELPVFSEKLNELLARITTGVRRVFPGRLTYSSGSWEDVDWTNLDIVGIDLYRDATNAENYLDLLHAYQQHDKPVWITEFGCCCYEGAQDRGSGGYAIVDWSTSPPQLNDTYTRNESVQATYLNELLDIFEQEGVDGAFIYQFIDPQLPHVPDDPLHDLDMAAFSIVKTYGDDADQSYNQTGYWEPKASFPEVASRFAGNDQPDATPIAPEATPIATT